MRTLLTNFICFLTIASTIPHYGCSQSANPFTIIDTLVQESTVRGMIKNLQRTNDLLFEDDQYIITKSCSGEWGGTIKLKANEMEWFMLVLPLVLLLSTN